MILEQNGGAGENKNREWSRGFSSEAVRLIDHLKEQPNALLVDVGAGEGRHSLYAAKSGIGKIIAIEQDPEQVALLEQRRMQENATQLEIRLGDAINELERLDNGSVNGIIDCGMSHYLNNLEKRNKFAQLVHEKLKPSGLYSITHFSEHEAAAQGHLCAPLAELQNLFPESTWDQTLLPWHEETWDSGGSRHFAYKAVLRKR
jgi:cyclopropane fatty-acyl-phospholipid synthase-like methyltransferase